MIVMRAGGAGTIAESGRAESFSPEGFVIG
jgi:hypothetical protein